MNTEKKCLQMNDIQRFVTMETTTLETLSDEPETYYEKLMIDLDESKLVYSRFGDKYPIPPNGDKTIEFRKYVSLPKAMTSITESVTPDGDEYNVTSVTMTVRRPA